MLKVKLALTNTMTAIVCNTCKFPITLDGIPKYCANCSTKLWVIE